ncbi:MAG TPA: NADH-quinone oxidoreductase subunit A [Candidatus Fraserbacteria bacterium]|nr:NADH-quinone oxidoreductase subunit A [Candidatus Fraserbacteria bacterium]
MELSAYLPLAIMAVLAAAIMMAILWLEHRLQPARPTPEKLETYECGEKPIGDTRKPIDIKYYIYVLIFLVMDVEIIFLIPWAVRFRQLGTAALVEILLFVAILLVGWGYAWKEGFLEWLR